MCKWRVQVFVGAWVTFADVFYSFRDAHEAWKRAHDQGIEKLRIVREKV